MKYKVLVVNSRVPFDFSSALVSNRQYFLDRTSLEIEYEHLFADFQIELADWGTQWKDGQPLYGTSGLRAWAEKNVDGKKYNAVVFLYDLEKTEWFKTQLGRIGHLTHWYPHQGAALIEIATRPSWGSADVYRVLTHELFHAYHQSCRMNGVPTEDTMDRYDEEMDVLSNIGNRARNILALKGHWSIVTNQPYLYVLLLLAKIKALQLLVQTMNPMKNIDKLVAIIKKHEGWAVGSRSYRNNNPGNVKYNPDGYRSIYGAVGKDEKGFAIFQTYDIGELYLKNWLRSVFSGKSYPYNKKAKDLGKGGAKDLTLREFFQVYCEDDPLTPENDPEVYARVAASELGVSVDAIVGQLFA